MEEKLDLPQYFERRLIKELYYTAAAQKVVLDRLPRYVIQVTPITTFHHAYRRFLSTAEKGIECVLARADRWKRFFVWRALTDRDVEIALRDANYRARILRSLKRAPPPDRWEYVFSVLGRSRW